MMQYKYHKGSEADFFGAPERAMVKLAFKYAEHSRCVFADKLETGATRTDTISGRYDARIICADHWVIIAHREPIPKEKALVTITNNSTDQLITERGSRYGKFKDGADIMQSLKDVMRDVDGWNNLTASQKEALDMIQHKIGRILNGDPTYDDSWKDIAGYATLIVNELNGEVK